MPDLEITCVQCKRVFIFSEKEQEIFYRKNLHPPQHCPKCRSEKAVGEGNVPKKFEIICDHCGRRDQVPFKPKVGREVLCRECHSALMARTRFV
ncbi:MAG: hypothetical protein D6687_04535 [Acidobacteria bacterium]|nr:MAG: hypothetical protein D6687_04535 [Acidobacteriota bacterium]GIU82939.1 MAG: hypothetical protein KatS3mg006_2003 [Pyrinomonadaceae bacterium]